MHRCFWHHAVSVLHYLLLSNMYLLKISVGQEVNNFSVSKRKSLQGALKVLHRMEFLGRFFSHFVWFTD